MFAREGPKYVGIQKADDRRLSYRHRNPRNPRCNECIIYPQVRSIPRLVTLRHFAASRESDARVKRARWCGTRLVPIHPLALPPLLPRRAVSISARPGAQKSLYKLISRYVLRYAASHRTTCRYLVLHRTSDRRG